MFKERLISGAILLVGLIVLIIVGSYPLWAASMMIGCVALYELYKAVGIDNNKLTWISYPLVVFYYLVCRNIQNYLAPIFAITVLIMTIYVIAFPRINFSNLAIGIIGIFYVGVLSSGLYLVRTHEDGIYYSCLVIAASWGADTLAYCAGMTLGKRHPFPTLSPKKSIAGCIGGVVGACIIGIILALCFKKSLNAAIVACAVGSVFSIIGDLCASAIKRQHNIKDYGNLIPGHGGLMDRFDSMLITGAVIFICVTLLY